ncbi:pp-loop family protein [Stagonosporopsis vannaccii]|nr:pp-loop family protein [Stagonosporopsis vannaccii]
MWRSNVLRVRKSSSAAAWRKPRRYSSQSLPVTIKEFLDVFNGMGGSCPLGFAISGGVDSMALASLFARSRESNPSNFHDVPAHAFIVDHKVRPGSTEEAEWVADQCRVKFGMQASVLPLTWPANFDPLDHKRFESDARTLRYQALGRACRAAGVTNLMVAHHADDQAETVLMRLANSRLRSGLQAMQPVEGIPECHGIYGVSHSGSHNDSEIWPFHRYLPFESGGIRILRPLLSFEKSRLIATCEEYGVAWVEDKTNHLQTYTSRNAIRHILKNHKLPSALSIQSLVDLSKRMQERVSSHKSKAQQLLANCSKRLNSQVGSLHIQFPRFQELLDECIDLPPLGNLADTRDQSKANRAKNTAICLLAQASQLVSPRENPPLGELASTVAHIWPEFRNFDLSGPSQEGETGTEIKTSYCVHGIWWRKCDSPSIEQPKKLRDATPRRAVQTEWLLTRQPLATHRIESALRSIRYPPSHMLSVTQATPKEWKGNVEPDWQLFDGRWWISIRNHTADALILRHFTKADLDNMKPIAEARRGGPEKYIAIALSLLKPADIRFTIPALFQCDITTKKETFVGFPTLNVSMDTLGCPKDICSWQVRYKKLGNEAGLPSTAFHGMSYYDSMITHAVIEKELARFDKTYKRTTPTRRSLKTQFHDLSAQAKSGSTSDAPGSVAARTQRTVPLVPTTESERRGRSERRKGGGYDIKWEDFGKRFR